MNTDLQNQMQLKALKQAMAHFFCTFDEAVAPHEIIREMRAYEDCTGNGRLFQPCDLYDGMIWEELADMIEQLAADLYEFGCWVHQATQTNSSSTL